MRRWLAKSASAEHRQQRFESDLGGRYVEIFALEALARHDAGSAALHRILEALHREHARERGHELVDDIQRGGEERVIQQDALDRMPGEPARAPMFGRAGARRNRRGRAGRTRRHQDLGVKKGGQVVEAPACE
jgi:hypothetical protein